MKIVIADDSSLLRDRIKSKLKDFQEVFSVYEADNGVKALKLIAEEDPDLVILDIMMPELNGIEVLIKIRELNLKVKVCMLTNYPYPQYKRRCIEAGADYFLRKAEDFEDLNKVISDLLIENRSS